MATGVLDATVSGPAANSYLTLDQADALFEGFRLEGMDKWDELEEDRQCALLIQGTRKIDEFRQWGARKVTTPAQQSLAFPRGDDPVAVIPLEVQHALMYYVQHILLDDMVPIKRMQAEGIGSASLLGQNVSMNTARDDEDASSELPAGARQQLKRLWGARRFFTINRNEDGSTDPGSFFG